MAFETVTDEIWQEDLDLKLFAAIRFSRLVWPGMKARKWGRIINVLNIGAKAPAAASTPTSVSRAAGMALTKAMANEGGPHNILVNAMLVGLIVSDQWVKRHATKAPDTDFDAFTRDLAKGVRSGGWGRRRNSPTSPASSPPSKALTSPAPPSMSMAAVRRWCSSFARGFMFRTRFAALRDEVDLGSSSVRSAATPRVSTRMPQRIARKRRAPQAKKASVTGGLFAS